MATRFTSTKLTGTGKKGILTPDENGYYTMAIGGLNVFNSSGEYYTAEGAEDLFKSSSIFMRRISSGCLKGESGHPKRTPGMTLDQYLNRILTIEEANVVCHFTEIWLDKDFGKKYPEYNNKDLIAIMAKVKPAGPKGESLKASFENPKEEVCFSIRALTKDFMHKGVNHRVLQQIVTFDNVVEPGIFHARKWHSPALESLTECNVKEMDIDTLVNSNKSCIAVESTKELALETLSAIKKQSNIKLVTLPVIAKW